MDIKRTRPPDSRIERQIIMGMIVSTRFLQEVKPLYSSESFNLDYARVVAKWCMEHFDKYKKAPGKDIEDIFHMHSENGLQEEQRDLISAFLVSISEEYEREEEFNADYILDKTEKHFRAVSLQRLRAGLGQSLVSGRIEDAEAMVKGYVRVTRAETEGIDPICSLANIAQAFREEDKHGMFSMPGDLGRVCGDYHRGYLVGILGASSIGKTWWLQFMALRGFFTGYNVLFVSLEMSRSQMVKRIQHTLTALTTKRHVGDILIPVFDCRRHQEDDCNKRQRTCQKGVIGGDGKVLEFRRAPRGYVPCTACRGNSQDYKYSVWHREITKEELGSKEAMKKSKQIQRANIMRGSRFKLVQYPSGSLTMSRFRAYLYNLEHYENFIPDVIVTDYADKFAPEDRRLNPRHQLRQIWEGHKALAQERHCLVVTASQSSATRSGKDTKQGDWSEAIGKLELVDIGIVLNQTADEKRQGLMRVMLAKQRHDDFDILGEVKVLQCYKIGKPYLDSYFGR